MAETTVDPQLYPGWTNQGQTGDNETSGTVATAALSSLSDSSKDPHFVTGWTNQSGTGDNESGSGEEAGSFTQPTVPATNTYWTNTLGVPVQVYLIANSGGTTTAVTLKTPGGTALTAIYATVATSATADFTVPMGWSVKFTYSSAPTWVVTPAI
jgi:hypothetical protein